MSAPAESHRKYSVPSLKATHVNAWCLRGIAFALCLGAALPAWGQSQQFATMADEGGAVVSPPVSSTAPPPSWASGPTSTFTPSPNPTAPPVGSPPGAPGTFDPYSVPSTQSVPSTAPPFSPYETPAPYASPAPYSPYTPSPYAAPATQPLYPNGIQMPQLYPQNTFAQPMRFLQELRLRDTQLLGIGSSSTSLSVNDVETSATFAFPFFGSNAPLLITPGFGMHFFGGPQTGPPDFADLPARTYDAYLDAGWHPQITPWLAANLGVRGGAYTDFDTFNTHSIRIMGRGLGIVTLTPTVQIAAGLVYIDRVRVKMLPAGGIIWTPNPDARYEILFPNPKLARRWSTLGNTDVWVYVSGEYGGGSWTIQRQDGSSDQADYDDIRVNLGIEAYGLRGQHYFFETGFAFDRKVIYRSGSPTFNAADTVMLRGGLSY